MIRYSVPPRDEVFVNCFGFLPFAKKCAKILVKT